MRIALVLTVIVILIVTVSFVTIPSDVENIRTQDKEINQTNSCVKNELPTGYNELFAGSGECQMCHDDMVNSQGASVSIISDWRSSMMANAARDPFWRAKVSHETLVNPDHAEVLEDVCTKCHAPIGRFNAHHMGQPLYSIEEMENDPLAMDGASCTVCHQIKNENLGIYSGNMEFDTDKIIWGPYEEPFTMPMINHTGYTPVFGQHIKDSRLCGSCHTLLTNPVDLSGVPTGTEFVEQAIYQEWKNSGYPDYNVSCQTCHVPEIMDSVVISTMPPWLEGRSPFGKHHLAGANVFMLKLLKQNLEVLGIPATGIQMDSTIARAQKMLQENSLFTSLEEVQRTEDTLFIDLTLENIAGHKFPGGYPSRRAFVELFVLNETNDTVFHSGKMNSGYNLIYEDEGFEQHYNIINAESEVQIYEMVMGNVEYEPTTILERAYVHLKDNRLPPYGFNTNHPSYDTIKIVGNAFDDIDFNKTDGSEGTGKDIVHYHIPISDINGTLSVTAIVHYQTVTEKWLENMFSYSSDEIDEFKSYYFDADREPVKVSEVEIVSTTTKMDENLAEQFRIYPNPAYTYINIDRKTPIKEIRFYNVSGRLVLRSNFNTDFNENESLRIDIPAEKGILFIELISSNGIVYTDKIVVL